MHENSSNRIRPSPGLTLVPVFWAEGPMTASLHPQQLPLSKIPLIPSLGSSRSFGTSSLRCFKLIAFSSHFENGSERWPEYKDQLPGRRQAKFQKENRWRNLGPFPQNLSTSTSPPDFDVVFCSLIGRWKEEERQIPCSTEALGGTGGCELPISITQQPW